MFLDKLIVLPPVTIATFFFTFPIYLTVYLCAFISVFMYGGRMFTSPIVCVDGPVGLNEYCANAPLTVHPTLTAYTYFEADVSWVLTMPNHSAVIALFLALLMLYWRGKVEGRLVEIVDATKCIVKSSDDFIVDMDNVRTSLWKYRKYNSFPLLTHILLSLFSLFILLPSWYLLHQRSDFVNIFEYQPYVPKEVVCTRYYYGSSGSMQSRYYVCSMIRADFVNTALYLLYFVGFLVILLLFINLLFLFALFFPLVNILVISLLFSITPSKARRLVSKYSKAELFFFYLLKLNMFAPIFQSLFDDYFYLQG